MVVKVLELSPNSHVTTEVQNLKFIGVKSTERASTFKQHLYVQIGSSQGLVKPAGMFLVSQHLNGSPQQEASGHEH